MSDNGRNTGDFVLSAFERGPEQSFAESQRLAGPLATYGPTAAYRPGFLDAGNGRAASSVTYPAISGSTVVGPFYGKADSSVAYPPISRGQEIGPFYGKADSSAALEVDRSQFPDY